MGRQGLPCAHTMMACSPPRRPRSSTVFSALRLRLLISTHSHSLCTIKWFYSAPDSLTGSYCRVVSRWGGVGGLRQLAPAQRYRARKKFHLGARSANSLRQQRRQGRAAGEGSGSIHLGVRGISRLAGRRDARMRRHAAFVCQTGPGCRPVARGTRIGSAPSPSMCI